ncbi:hypothetical protein CRG98_037460 [Punica granatum]|uniref:Uncharacterized protein n=1 Tax=Punica granatum TaxID=22663 RepID=A0A2I0IDR7_PUNGR|nr:hypothetical protein CRG98_037460 [Punica granatum]
MGERRNHDALIESPVIRCEVVEVPALACLENLVAGWAKTEFPPVLVLFHIDGAGDTLAVCLEAGTGDVVVLQPNLPNHAVSTGWTNLSVIPDDGDDLERMEGDVLISIDADVGDDGLLINHIVLFVVDCDELALNEELELLEGSSSSENEMLLEKIKLTISSIWPEEELGHNGGHAATGQATERGPVEGNNRPAGPGAAADSAQEARRPPDRLGVQERSVHVGMSATFRDMNQSRAGRTRLP